MSKKYRRKNDDVEAIQWTGKNLEEMCQFLGDCLGPIERRPDYKLKIKGKNDERHYWVEMDVGDFVKKDDLGFHVVKERWFHVSYEEVQSNSPSGEQIFRLQRENQRLREQLGELTAELGRYRAMSRPCVCMTGVNSDGTYAHHKCDRCKALAKLEQEEK